jgi:CheY-like chemotaxis protein
MITPTPGPAPDFGPPLVVLVEDEEPDVVRFQRLASRCALQTDLVVAWDAAEALDVLRGLAEAGRRAVVVTDINLPGLSGHDLIDEVRRDPRLQAMVVFVLSSSNLQSDIERAYARHVAGYIVKDGAADALEEGVRMLAHYCRAISLPG